MSLKLDWCDYKSAKWAVEHWHYSQNMPKGKLVHIGVWEDGVFKGVVLFGRGANNNMLKPYGLTQYEGCELVRIALREHWIYLGKAKSTPSYWFKGKWTHQRTININIANGRLTRAQANKLKTKPASDKYRYAYPLNDIIRKQLLEIAKEYPKRT